MIHVGRNEVAQGIAGTAQTHPKSDLHSVLRLIDNKRPKFRQPLRLLVPPYKLEVPVPLTADIGRIDNGVNGL